ncbi:uncharacterized protein LOC103577339 isoform X2 [Microplitis demolitor]|uniref:uncharacterized protein LOC103577339 isoform X2 n=1 Tax=Microplitis demolitor TaxID=69319 RepID=UPI0004CC9193|nr:uncharacterized protein LOC103577339 isoform X2 [Microplitis demolitor]
MVKFSSIIYLRSLALVSLISLMVDSKSHHAHHATSHLHPHSNSRHQRHYDLHHRKSNRNKRSESTVNPLNDVNFINNNSNNKSMDIINTDSDKSMINSDKSLVDLEKLFGPIPHQLYDHIRVKRNNLKNNFGESNSRASSEYLKKLADSFAGPAAENDQDNFDELETNDRQLSFNSDDVMRKKRRALDNDFEETNFFPDDSGLVNLIRTKRFGDPDKKIGGRSAKGKRNVRNKNIKLEHADGKGRDGFRLKRKSKITGNKRLKKENLKVDKLSRVNKVKDKSKLKRCTKSGISKNDKNLNKKHDKVKNKIRKRRNSGDSKALAPLEEIRDLAANLVSKVDELEGSIKINRRSGRNSHGYPAISNSKRVHHLLGSRHSDS